jgi:hypothetical protein
VKFEQEAEQDAQDERAGEQNQYLLSDRGPIAVG